MRRWEEAARRSARLVRPPEAGSPVAMPRYATSTPAACWSLRQAACRRHIPGRGHGRQPAGRALRRNRKTPRHGKSTRAAPPTRRAVAGLQRADRPFAATNVMGDNQQEKGNSSTMAGGRARGPNGQPSVPAAFLCSGSHLANAGPADAPGVTMAAAASLAYGSLVVVANSPHGSDGSKRAGQAWLQRSSEMRLPFALFMHCIRLDWRRILYA